MQSCMRPVHACVLMNAFRLWLIAMVSCYSWQHRQMDAIVECADVQELLTPPTVAWQRNVIRSRNGVIVHSKYVCFSKYNLFFILSCLNLGWFVLLHSGSFRLLAKEAIKHFFSTVLKWFKRHSPICFRKHSNGVVVHFFIIISLWEEQRVIFQH